MAFTIMAIGAWIAGMGDCIGGPLVEVPTECLVYDVSTWPDYDYLVDLRDIAHWLTHWPCSYPQGCRVNRNHDHTEDGT